MNVLLWTAAALWLSGAPAAQAPIDEGAPPPESVELGTVVRARREPHSAPDSVTSVELKPWVGSGRSITSVIESVPGVVVRRSGANQGSSSVNLRGFGGRSVAIVLDEVPLSSATLAPVDLGVFDLDEMDRVEVHRGSGPVRFAVPLGGLIRLRSASSAAGARGEVATGSFGQVLANASYATQLSNSRYRLRIGGISGPFDYRYFDDGGTNFTDVDDSVRRRENNRQRRVSVRLGSEFDRENGSFEAWSWVLGRDQQVPGPGSARGVQARSKDVQALTRLARSKLRFGPSSLSVGTDLLVAQRQLEDPGATLGLGTQESRQRLFQLALDGRWQYRITGAHRLEWATRASAYRYRITSESGLLLDELGQDRDSLALGSGIEWRSVLADGLTLFGRLRFDGERLSSDTLSALSPSLGATWVLGPCLLRGLIGRRHRLPTLLERFGDNVLTVANPSLAEETALSADLGTRCAGELGSLSFTGFTLSARDLIVLVQNSQRSVRAENIGRARVSGVEALATISAGPASARIAYTLSDAVDTAAEAELPGIPTHRAHLTLEYQWRTFRVGWVSDFASARALARDGLNRVPSRLLHDAYIRWGWNEVLELNASAFNLTNTIRNTLDVPGAAEPVIAGLSDFLSYPLAGRTLFLGLTIRSKA